MVEPRQQIVHLHVLRQWHNVIPKARANELAINLVVVLLGRGGAGSVQL